MPIRINLKEIFPSDPQEIVVNKLNFNYNKLLELGVGTPGPIGLTGPQGPAGPIGLVGPQGDRGATWWVGSGDPNTLTFTGLIDGDMYLDQTSSVFQIWRYDDVTSTWNQVVNIAALVNSYLSSISTIPFETVTTLQAPGSTPVNKFILFDKRDDYGADATRGTANVSLNNMLFLNNFDETDITYPALGQAQYNSLLSIFPAHDDTQESGRAQSGRYHIEMGSLYMDDDILPIGTIKYSELKHNLKGKFYKQYIDPSLPPHLPLTNTWINTAKFSLSFTESQTLLDIDQNAAFEFLFPKWNNENPAIGGVTSWTADGLGTGYTTAIGVLTTGGGGTGLTVDITASAGAITAVIVNNLGSGYEVGDIVTINGGSTSESLTITSVILPVQEELSVVLSSAEAIVERSPAHTHIVADGIHVSTKSSSINATLGLALDFVSLNTKLDGKNHLMLDSNSGVDGVILLNKGAFINGDANIVDGVAIGSGYEDLTAPANSLIVEGQLGIGTSAPSANSSQHIYATGSTTIKTISLLQIDTLSFSGFVKILYGQATTITDVTGYPTTTMYRTSFSGSSEIGLFTGMEIDLSLATSVLHSSSFYGTKIALDNTSVFSGSNRQVYGNFFQLNPNLSSATGGSIRGNQIEIDNYIPNSTTTVRGSQLTLSQIDNIAQGETYGININLLINSINSASSNVTGLNLTMNTGGLSYSLPNESYSINIFNSGDVPAGGETYGLKYDYFGTLGDAASQAYGYHISGATANYAEGDSRFNGSVSINDDDTNTQYVKNVWHGWITFGFNATQDSAPGWYAYYVDHELPNANFIPQYDGGAGVTNPSRGLDVGSPNRRAILYLKHPTISTRKSTMQVTMRNGGASGANIERTAVTNYVSLGASESAIYFDNVDDTGGYDWTTQTWISFAFTLTEWA